MNWLSSVTNFLLALYHDGLIKKNHCLGFALIVFGHKALKLLHSQFHH